MSGDGGGDSLCENRIDDDDAWGASRHPTIPLLRKWSARWFEAPEDLVRFQGVGPSILGASACAPPGPW